MDSFTRSHTLSFKIAKAIWAIVSVVCMIVMFTKEEIDTAKTYLDAFIAALEAEIKKE